MSIFDRLQDGLNKGLLTSRDLFSKAKDKAQELGEKGVLKIEILQLEDQISKLATKLGVQTLETLTRAPDSSVSRATPGVEELLREIEELRRLADEKQAMLRTRNP